MDSASAKKLNAFGLEAIARKRYNEQILIVDRIDPYTVNKAQLSSNFESFPHITYPDIVNYLLFAPSPYSRYDLKNFKSLESYNNFVCGWVSYVGVCEKIGKFIILGRVSFLF